MGRKYLDDVGYDHQSLYKNMSGEREIQFKVERAVYGFDSSETWALDKAMTVLLYERLCMLKEKTDDFIDFSIRQVEIYGEVKDPGEWLEEMIDLGQEILGTSVYDDDWDEVDELEKMKLLWLIWSRVFPYMWW